MILITGPTGSGKTSSLYAMLTRLGAERHNLVNISTIEDPVEYTMMMQRQDTSAIRAAAIAGGMKTMFQDGIAKAFFGETSLEEVFRVAI
jgi:type II secretory ATPase GspE/PulE/Tfp pilus assembly ATPase PilB-like protein